MRIEIVSAGYVLNEDNSKLLMIKRDKPPWKGFWLVPGGHVEDSELPHEALKREIREETGLEVEILDFHSEDMKKYRSIEHGFERLPHPFIVQKEASGHKDHVHLNFVYICKAKNKLNIKKDEPIKWMDMNEIENTEIPKNAKIWAVKVMETIKDLNF